MHPIGKMNLTGSSCCCRVVARGTEGTVVMQKVTADTWREEILVDLFKGVATGAKCAKCGYKVFELGVGAGAANRCADRLRAECPRRECNEYICKERAAEEEPPAVKSRSR